MAKLHVLFVENAAITGGAERHTAMLASRLAAADFETAIFAIRRGTDEPAGVALLEPEGNGSLKRIGQLAQCIGERRIDLLVAVNQRPLLVASLARRLARVKPAIAVIFHTTELRDRKEEMMQLGYNHFFNRADSVIFISDNQRRHWAQRGLGAARAVTIHNGVDLGRFSLCEPAQRRTMRATLGLDDGDYVVGCIAMLRAEKNHLDLVEAIAQLRGKGVRARAVLVGDGPMRAAITGRAVARGVSQHVILAGAQDDVRPFIAAFDVGVLTSTSVETLSLSALEIMAGGRPMVMSDIGGASEIVHGANGALFLARDVGGLVVALEHFVSKPTRDKAGAAARRTVECQFDIDRMIERYADHFWSLAGPPRG
jgi:glycosyltransferase involved in cell wall biosynthesis